MFDWLKTALSKKSKDPRIDRRVRFDEEEKHPERFNVIILLMAIFFFGLLALEFVHMVVLGTWSEVIFNAIMLVVGTIVGAVWGIYETARWLEKTKADTEVQIDRRSRLAEDGETPDRFIVIVQLMVIFFVGLLGLEVVHMVYFGAWNEMVFNGIMLVVGTIVGAVWGRFES